MENKQTQPMTDQPKAATQSWAQRSLRQPAFWPIILIIIVVILGGLLLSSRAFHQREGSRAFYGGIAQNGLRRSGRFTGGINRGPGLGRGVLGAVTNINGDAITIKQNDQGVTVKVTSTTAIYKANAIAKQTDIKVGDVIIVRGVAGSDGAVMASSIVIN